MIKVKRISKLKSTYFQKSMYFLYPFLDISKKVIPINTYIKCNKYKNYDYLFICVFNAFTGEAELEIEKNELIKHRFLIDMFKLKDGKLVYVFDLQRYKNNYDKFLSGEYSKFNDFFRSKLLTYYKDTEDETHMHCYLYPSLYYETFSDILEVDVANLTNSELASKLDIEKETLKITKKHLDN
jgi:hypothetical protein